MEKGARDPENVSQRHLYTEFNSIKVINVKEIMDENNKYSKSTQTKI